MSSFHKAIDLHTGINGTKIKNSLLCVSSGIPSLDHVIGGGLPTNALFAVEEDVLGTYSKVLMKYFLAEGVVSKHDLFIASADDDPKSFILELPQVCAAPTEEETKTDQEDLNKMKIAWRYEGLSQVESSFGSNTTFGHHFDLSKHIDHDTLKSSNIKYWSPDNVTSKSCEGFKNHVYYDLLSTIKELVSKDEYKSSSKNKNILRISIASLGSPTWLAMDCEEHSEASGFLQDLTQFMFLLRVVLRDTTAVAFISIPTHLFHDDTLIKRILYSVDNAVKIESFAGSSRETNPVFKDYHGLFHITKLSSTNSLVPFVPPSLDLAFKLRRKKFVIEKLHLPPELEETSEREQDDITAVPACGGFKKKDIDF